MAGEQELPWLQGIQGEDARELIQSDARLIRVVAGPGAGKTTCLKRRIQRLVQGEGHPPERVFVGTFTRAIARDLKAELGDAVAVSTLHSLAFRLLRENPGACQGLKLRFLLAYEEGAMLYDIATTVTNHATQNDRRRELLRLQSARSERQTYDDAAFAGAVRTWLEGHGAMLVGEVVYIAALGLESQDISPGEFDHVVIDEYQDLTASEQELVERIWSENGSLVVMGDNNQSIYSFRFNHPGGIDEFSQRWEAEGSTDLQLPENRRCGEAILHVANLMMAEAGSSNPPMEAASGLAGDVALVHWPSSSAEVDGLAQYIKERAEETFLVLVPRRFIGYRLKDAIGDDAVTAFHEEVLEHPLAQERFALASVLADLSDRVAIRAWLGLDGHQAVQGTRRNSVAYASLPAHPDGLTLVAGIVDGSIPVTGAGQANVKARAATLKDHIDAGRVQSLTVIDLAFDPSLAVAEADAEKSKWLAADLEALRDAAHSIESTLEEPTLANVMASLRHRIATRASLSPDDEEPRVQIMTLHSAKGLEGDNIIVAGVADQLMPGLSVDPEEIAEQRRLLYVAVTRAKERLVVSWPRSVSYGDAIANGVRIDGQLFTESGTTMVKLTRTRLLPAALPGGVAGGTWLQS